MPAPLAKPLMRTSVPPIATLRVASFGNVSVVMMARAASCHAVALALPARSPIRWANLVASSGSPITPVEET
jgi:hypothetical protein